MARLSSERLDLEIILLGSKCDWFNYEIRILWDDEPILNPALLKRGEYGRPELHPGSLWANDYKDEHLVETLEGVLESNAPDYWEPLEPDLMIAFYPDMVFPFIESRWKVVYQSERRRRDVDARKILKAANNGKLPSDPFTVVLAADSASFRGQFAYSGSGPAMVLLTTREDVTAFCHQLKLERDSLQSAAPSFPV